MDQSNTSLTGSLNKQQKRNLIYLYDNIERYQRLMCIYIYIFLE